MAECRAQPPGASRAAATPQPAAPPTAPTAPAKPSTTTPPPVDRRSGKAATFNSSGPYHNATLHNHHGARHRSASCRSVLNRNASESSVTGPSCPRARRGLIGSSLPSLSLIPGLAQIGRLVFGFRPVRNIGNPPLLLGLKGTGRLGNGNRSAPVHDLPEHALFGSRVCPARSRGPYY